MGGILLSEVNAGTLWPLQISLETTINFIDYTTDTTKIKAKSLTKQFNTLMGFTTNVDGSYLSNFKHITNDACAGDLKLKTGTVFVKDYVS